MKRGLPVAAVVPRGVLMSTAAGSARAAGTKALHHDGFEGTAETAEAEAIGGSAVAARPLTGASVDSIPAMLTMAAGMLGAELAGGVPNRGCIGNDVVEDDGADKTGGGGGG